MGESTDRIPITTQMAMPIIDLFCAKTACESLIEILHLEEYANGEVAFDRGKPKDGSILVKSEGRDVFELKETGIISNLEHHTEFNFCPTSRQCNTLTSPDGKTEETCFDPPQHVCNNPVKILIAALFGESELTNPSLTHNEAERVQKLRAAIGLKSSEEIENPSANAKRAPTGGSFFSDRWRGWRLGGSAIFNHYQGPGGGTNLWLGYRQDRWDFRIALQGEGVKLQGDLYDFRLGTSFEPIFHLLEHPFLLDPYINLPEIGIYHLFNQDASGISFSPLGAGLQIHLNDSWSLYAGAKLRGAFTFEEKPKLGAEVPLGFSGHF